MPIYEYQCQQCGHHHEALQKISEPQLRQCPECGRRSLKRLVSAVRFRLAGSGWYETDFKSDKEAKRNLHEKGDREEAKKDGGDAAEAGAKSDAKDAAKDTAKPDTKSESPTTAASESAASTKRARLSRPAAAPVRSKANGSKKPVRRAPAARQRRR
jgi:putative FmdB family regulatory protein